MVGAETVHRQRTQQNHDAHFVQRAHLLPPTSHRVHGVLAAPPAGPPNSRSRPAHAGNPRNPPKPSKTLQNPPKSSKIRVSFHTGR